MTCTVASRQGMCSNTRSIKRHRIEAVVVDVLRTRLMQPEACAEFSIAFEEECARAEKNVAAVDASRHRELDKVRHKLDELVEAIASGLRSTTLQNKLSQLEARQAELEQEVGLPPRRSIVLPIDLAGAYRQEVVQLSSSTNGAEGTKTRELIRGLIERVIITPASDGKGSEVELVGEIAAMINLALLAEPGGKRQQTLGLTAAAMSSLQVVAGTGNHRQLTPIRVNC